MKITGTVRELIKADIISPNSKISIYPNSLVEIMPSEEELNNFVKNVNSPQKTDQAIRNIAYAMDLEKPAKEGSFTYVKAYLVPEEFFSKEPVNEAEIDLEKILNEILSGKAEETTYDDDEGSEPIFIIALSRN